MQRGTLHAGQAFSTDAQRLQGRVELAPVKLTELQNAAQRPVPDVLNVTGPLYSCTIKGLPSVLNKANLAEMQYRSDPHEPGPSKNNIVK